jgi:hypothetical protein
VFMLQNRVGGGGGGGGVRVGRKESRWSGGGGKAFETEYIGGLMGSIGSTVEGEPTPKLPNNLLVHRVDKRCRDVQCHPPDGGREGRATALAALLRAVVSIEVVQARLAPLLHQRPNDAQKQQTDHQATTARDDDGPLYGPTLAAAGRCSAEAQWAVFKPGGHNRCLPKAQGWGACGCG